MNILIISKFSSSEINQAKVAFGSYFLLNYKDNYTLHILTSESKNNYSEFIKRIKPFCNIEFHNNELLEHISIFCNNFKNIIILNQNTLTLKQIDIYYDYFNQFQMIGNLRYQSEFDLIRKGYKIPFIEGIFSNGWLMLNNIKFDISYIQKFIKTFNISRNRKDFDEIFLSWFCQKKLKTNDISVESTYYHNNYLNDLKLVYYSENPYNVYPWIKNNKSVYIMYYIKEYIKICKIFKCEYIENEQFDINIFNEDLKHKYIFKNWDKVFIPISERNYQFNIF